MKVLLTGINGQVGSYLAELYLKQGWEVHGTVRQRSDLEFLQGIDPRYPAGAVTVLDGINLHLQDIRDPHGVLNLIQKEKPNVVHHLAAMSYVPYSWENPIDTFTTNVLGTINLLEATRSTNPGTVIQFAGSSEEYGAVPQNEIPINEKTPSYPASPYGISKQTGDLLFQQYHRSYAMHTVISRTFNHTSPRRGDIFLTKQVVLQALEIKHGKKEAFRLGNLQSVRDFTDCRDVALAYYLSVTHPKVEYGRPYVVASGKGHSTQQVVDMVAELAGIPNKVEVDPARLRPSDVPAMIGDSTLFRNTTGWSPKYEFRETLQWMLDTLEAERY